MIYPDEPTPGTRAALDHMLRAFAYNVNLRVLDEGRKDVTQSVRVHEIGVRRDDFVPDIDLGSSPTRRASRPRLPDMEPVVIYPEDEHGVTVSAILVQHAPVFPALGYRFDTPAGAVVFSGDTGECPNIARLARDADVLVHEVLDVGPMMNVSSDCQATSASTRRGPAVKAPVVAGDPVSGSKATHAGVVGRCSAIRG